MLETPFDVFHQSTCYQVEVPKKRNLHEDLEFESGRVVIGYNKIRLYAMQWAESSLSSYVTNENWS